VLRFGGIIAVSTVGEIGERAIIERIRARLSPPPAWVAIGIGDDAAVIRPERNRAEVITTDALVEGVHFDRAYVPAAAIGHKALAVNLSDLAAMGAEPRAALLSLVLPADLSVADLDAILDGLLGLANRHGVALVGGNVARSPGPLLLDVTATGVVKPRRVLSRTGARPGDDIYVSGLVGAAAAGLLLCQRQAGAPRERSMADESTSPSNPVSAGLDAASSSKPASAALDAAPPWNPDSAGLDPASAACVDRFLRPEPRLRLGQLLARSGVVTSCIDLSDGFADAVQQVATASRVGAIIEADAIPVPDAARAVLGDGVGAGWLEAAIAGGEDYELLFTAPPRRRRALSSALQHAQGVSCTKIGRVTRDRRLRLRRATGDEALPVGFAHFR
jgi:thiamine-monophosphate kinase